MRSRRLLLFVFGGFLIWGAGAALHSQAASPTVERDAQSWDSRIPTHAPSAAMAVEAGGAEQPGERLKPEEKICDLPRWGALSAGPRQWRSQPALLVTSREGAVAPSLVGIVVLLI